MGSQALDSEEVCVISIHYHLDIKYSYSLIRILTYPSHTPGAVRITKGDDLHLRKGLLNDNLIECGLKCDLSLFHLDHLTTPLINILGSGSKS